MKLKPLGDKVIVERTAAESTSKGGIILPDSAKEKPRQGAVLSVGPGKLLDDGTRKASDIKKGDTVLFSSYGGTDIKIGGKEYLILDTSDIMAIIS